MSYEVNQRLACGRPRYNAQFQPLNYGNRGRFPHPNEMRSARRVSEAPHAHLFVKNPPYSESRERTYEHLPTKTKAKETPVEEKGTSEKQELKKKPAREEYAPIPPPRGPTAWETFWEWNFPEEGGILSWVMTTLHICTLGIVLALAWGICYIIDYCNESPKPLNAAPISPDNLIDLQDYD